MTNYPGLDYEMGITSVQLWGNDEFQQKMRDINEELGRVEENYSRAIKTFCDATPKPRPAISLSKNKAFAEFCERVYALGYQFDEYLANHPNAEYQIPIDVAFDDLRGEDVFMNEFSELALLTDSSLDYAKETERELVDWFDGLEEDEFNIISEGLTLKGLEKIADDMHAFANCEWTKEEMSHDDDDHEL